MTNNKNYVVRVLVLVSFFIMLAANILSVALPLNGVTPAQVSDSYPNLFAPAGITFAIWGVIYLLLLCYSIYQLLPLRGETSPEREQMLNKVGIFFIISSLANAAWIFAWHYQLIPLSVILMLVILVCLIIIENTLSAANLTFLDKVLIRLPFSVYFGWITIATIANITALLVSVGWNGFGIPEQVWTIIVIFVGMIIAIATILKNQDVAYGLTIIWAYIGILIKQVSPDGFNGQYQGIIAATVISITLVLIVSLYVFLKKVRQCLTSNVG